MVDDWPSRRRYSGSDDHDHDGAVKVENVVMRWSPAEKVEMKLVVEVTARTITMMGFEDWSIETV